MPARQPAPVSAEPSPSIVDAIARGDYRAALTLIMQELGDDIHRHVTQVLGNRSLADDVHQQVFVEVFRDLPRFRGDASLRTWVYAIARHRCLDAIKTNGRWWHRFAPARELPEPADPGPPVDDAIDARRRCLALGRAIARLSPKHRIPLLLRYQEGLSYAEIAQVCGASAATLQIRVARAVARIRAELEADDAL